MVALLTIFLHYILSISALFSSDNLSCVISFAPSIHTSNSWASSYPVAFYHIHILFPFPTPLANTENYCRNCRNSLLSKYVHIFTLYMISECRSTSLTSLISTYSQGAGTGEWGDRVDKNAATGTEIWNQ